MFKKVFVFLLVYFLAFYPVLTPLANASADVGQGFSRADTMDETAKLKVQQSFGRLPLYFIQNNGQIDEKVKYYEKGSGHATYFTEEGIYLLLQTQKSKIKIPNLKDTATNSSLQTLEPSNPRTLEPSNPRTLEPSNPRTLEQFRTTSNF